MSESGKEYLYSYEENERLSAAIQEIMGEKTSDIIKIKKLRIAQSTVSSQICKSHVQYYLNQLESKKRTLICHSICRVILVLFTLFMLLFDFIAVIDMMCK